MVVKVRLAVKVLLLEARMSTFACQLCACGSDRTRSHDPIEECQVESRKRMCTWQVAKGPAGILACRPFLQLSSCWQTCKASSGCRNRTLHSTHLSLRLPATSWFEETSVLTSNSDRALLSSSVVDSSICCKARTQMECHRTFILSGLQDSSCPAGTHRCGCLASSRATTNVLRKKWT